MTGWIKEIPPGQIGVAARSNHYADQALTRLKAAGIPSAALARKHTDSEVGIGTMHRMKGVEFRCVAVIDLNEHAVPPASAVTSAAEDEAAHDRDVQRERCLLFVACTRAREQLTVSWHGTPSTFLSMSERESARMSSNVHRSIRVPWHDSGWSGTACRPDALVQMFRDRSQLLVEILRDHG